MSSLEVVVALGFASVNLILVCLGAIIVYRLGRLEANVKHLEVNVEHRLTALETVVQQHENVPHYSAGIQRSKS